MNIMPASSLSSMTPLALSLTAATSRRNLSLPKLSVTLPGEDLSLLSRRPLSFTAKLDFFGSRRDLCLPLQDLYPSPADISLSPSGYSKSQHVRDLKNELHTWRML